MSQLVTVLMPVYNGEKYLQQATASILNQSYPDIRLIIANDGSTDRSDEIVRSFRDSRIDYFHSKVNMGITHILRQTLDRVSSKYLARMDADDIAHKDRIAKQVGYMKMHPNIAACGTWIRLKCGEQKKEVKYPVEHEKIKCQMLFENPIVHPSAMIDMEKLRRFGINYNTEFQTCQDYDLWQRLSGYYQLANISKVLLDIRYHQNQIRMKNKSQQIADSNRVRRNILCLLDDRITEHQINLHNDIAVGNTEITKQKLNESHSWLLKLIAINNHKGFYDNKALKAAAARAWFRLCNLSTKLGLFTLKSYFNSSLRDELEIYEKAKYSFIVRCAIGI